MEGPAREDGSFAPFVVGDNTCILVQSYFPKAVLRTILPDHLAIPDDATMNKFYPSTRLNAREHPFMLSFCNGQNIHDVFTEVDVPEQEELMALIPVVYTHDDGSKYLCSYIPVLYLNTKQAVEGGLHYGLRKEYHPEMKHGGDGTSSLWWSVEGILEGSFAIQTEGRMTQNPHFFARTLANPYVTISYPPESRTVFYKAEVEPDTVMKSSGAFQWNYSGVTVQDRGDIEGVYSKYSFTMSSPMSGTEYFGGASEPNGAHDGGIPSSDGAVSGTHVIGNVHVPRDFAATPNKLMVLGFSSYPPPKQEIPLFLATVNRPSLTIGPNNPYSLDFTTTTTGTLYLTTILYVEGGGTMVPAAGIDYVASPDAAITLDGTDVDLGDIMLMKMPDGML